MIWYVMNYDISSFVVFAGRPDQVHNCTLTNISMTSLTVKCIDGFNGGLPQSFMLEIKDLNSFVSELCGLDCSVPVAPFRINLNSTFHRKLSRT